MLIERNWLSIILRTTLGLLLILCLQALSSGQVMPAGVAEAAVSVNARDFGAKGNGSTNDTDAIQRAIDSLPSTGGTVVISSGTYLIDAVKSIKLKDNVTLQMTPTTILQVIPNNAEYYAVLSINNVGNAKIIGGVLIGDRNRHRGTTGEWGMGIKIISSRDIIVQGTTAKDFWGDGFYIGRTSTRPVCSNIQLINVTADNNRRQGISLIAGQNITIAGCRLVNTQGTSPSSGIDIEPLTSADILQNIEIKNTYTGNNLGPGIGLALNNLAGITTPITVTITNHQDNGSKYGLSFNDTGVLIPGRVAVSNTVWKNSVQYGLAVRNHDYRSYGILVEHPQIIDCNAKGTGAVAVFQFTGGTSILGNVTVENALIANSRTALNPYVAFYILDLNGRHFVNTRIVAPVFRSSITTKLQTSDPNLKIIN